MNKKKYPRWVRIVIPEAYKKGYEQYYKDLFDLDGDIVYDRFLVTGEVVNMPGHFIGITHKGKNVLNVHDDFFVELDPEEV